MVTNISNTLGTGRLTRLIKWGKSPLELSDERLQAEEQNIILYYVLSDELKRMNTL
jgi:hypothetical protein